MALTAKQWQAIRKSFEQTDTSVASLAETHGVSRPAIDKRAKKEGWTINEARQDLIGRRAGGTNVGEKVDSGETGERAAPTVKQIADVKRLYVGVNMTLENIAAQAGLTVFDVEEIIVSHPAWVKYAGEGALKDADPPHTADPAAVSAMHTKGAARGSGFAEDEDGFAKVSFADIRRELKRIVKREPDDALKRSKRLKPEELVTKTRDVVDRLINQIDDIIGNRDSIVELLEEAVETKVVSASRYAVLFQAFEVVKLTAAAQKLASAAKMLVEQSEARAGKKDRQREDAKSEATDESSPFAKRAMPPRVVASGGERVS